MNGIWEPQGPSPPQPTEKDPVFFITSAQHAQPTGSESSDLAIWQSDRESVRREEKKIITPSEDIDTQCATLAHTRLCVPLWRTLDSVGASGSESTTAD